MDLSHVSPIARHTALAVLLSVATAARADDATGPSWGRIDDASAALGRFRFLVTTWPSDGKLPVPQGFPQLLRAADGTDPSRGLLVEYNADASSVAILAPTDHRPSVVEVETADDTRQFDDGRIVLAARSAVVDGTNAKLESHPGNHRIGFWSKQSDNVSWTWKPTRWGAYEAVLVYSTASPSGSEVEVAIGDVKLPATLQSTGSWYRYATLPLGRLVIPTADERTVRVRCTKLVGGAVMNLKAIMLTPACEGSPPQQEADGSVTLHGRDATVRGTTLRWEPAEKKQTLGFWTKPTDAAEWEFTLDKPGTFDVEVVQGCGTGQGGSEMELRLDPADPAAAGVKFTVEDTGGFQAFKPLSVGSVTIGSAGAHRLRVWPRRISKSAACDIRQIRLVPVDR